MPNAVIWMQERLADGQDPVEVAEVISSVIASENHQFRYQLPQKESRPLPIVTVIRLEKNLFENKSS
jgi:hypothetical protein